MPPGLFDFASESEDQEKTSFDEERNRLRGPYRVALAHAGPIRGGGRTLTAASAQDMTDVATKIPLLRYMARVVLKNVEATLDSTATPADGGVEPEDEPTQA